MLFTQPVNGQLGFGDGVTQDNIFGTFVNVTAPGTANTEFSITHHNAIIPYRIYNLLPGPSGNPLQKIQEVHRGQPQRYT